MKTDSGSHFRLVVRRTSSPEDIALHVFAFTPGYAVDSQSLDVGREEYQATLSLPPEQPLRGRAIGPQGDPAAQVKVSLGAIRKTGPGIETLYPFWRPPEGMPAWPEPTHTDDEGRFTRRGVARNSQVQVEVEDERLARQWWEFEVGDKA